MGDQMPLFESLEDIDAQARRVREHEADVKDAQRVLEESDAALHATEQWQTRQEALEALKAAKATLAKSRRALTSGCMARVPEAELQAVQ